MTEHLLSPDEKVLFFQQGYLIVENALSDTAIYQLKRAINHLNHDQSCPLNIADVLGKGTAFLDLIDLSTIFAKIWGLLGANIWVNHSHCNFNPPEKPKDKIYYGWHRDGGAMHFDMESMPPLLSLKTAFYLTDIMGNNCGETLVIPGSQLDKSKQTSMTPFQKPPNSAIALRVRAGSAVIYHNRLVHSLHSPNYSSQSRYAVFIQWAYRWLMPVDPMQVSHLDATVTDPIRRQLLGLTTINGYFRNNANLAFTGQNRSGRYYPRATEIPLRNHITSLGQEQQGRIWSMD